MRPSHLLDPSACSRALKDFLGALGTGRRLRSFLDRAGERGLHYDRVQYPRFNLFMADTHKWFIPRPVATVPEFLKLYDNFADRQLGAIPNPGLMVLDMYPGSAWARRVFTYIKHDDMWQSPARCLLAASLWLGGEVEEAHLNRVRIRFGAGILEVDETGCYVNRRQSFRRAAGEAFDQHFPATTFDPINHRHQLLQLMATEAMELPPRMMYACTALAHAMDEEIISRTWIKEQLESQESTGPQKTVQAVERSLWECSRILEEVDGNVVQRLYDSAVPNLMTAYEFRIRFGNPKLANPTRKIKPATIERWHGVIKSYYEALSHAK